MSTQKQKVFTVFKASCDGGRLEAIYKHRVCSSKESAQQTVLEFIKPVEYGDGPAFYVKDKVDSLRGKVEGMVCWRPSIIVYVEESELY